MKLSQLPKNKWRIGLRVHYKTPKDFNSQFVGRLIEYRTRNKTVLVMPEGAGPYVIAKACPPEKLEVCE